MFHPYEDVIEAYASFLEVLRALTFSISDSDSKKRSLGLTDWTIVEVICHLCDCEMVAVQRTKSIILHDTPRLEPFDQEEWAVEKKYIEQDFNEVQEKFISFRNEHVMLLTDLKQDEWQRIGIHDELGPISIYDHIVMMLSHDLIHSKQIIHLLREL